MGIGATDCMLLLYIELNADGSWLCGCDTKLKLLAYNHD